MKISRLIFSIIIMLLAAAGLVGARAVRIWSHQELLDKSDLVVIAMPTATNDTEEHVGLPGFTSQPVIGIETKFSIAAVMKGDKTLKEIILHHYRPPGPERTSSLPNGPTFVAFDPAKKQTFLLYLTREKDGRYAPTFGQVDPGACGIHVLGGSGQ